MAKTVHSKFSKIFCDHVRTVRERVGMSQRDLAAALGRERGLVSRIETGERRVDIVEIYWLFRALGVEPVVETAKILEKFTRLDLETQGESGQMAEDE